MPDYSTIEPSSKKNDITTYLDGTVLLYFVFACVSSAVRSTEAGIVSSMILDIKRFLGFDYEMQGLIAASPDLGLVPGALIAAIVYQHLSAARLLQILYFIIGIAMVAASIHPEQHVLVGVRAVAGFAWAFAAIHYPAWVNRHGPQDKRTMWLAIYQCCVLGGIFIGYILGGFTTRYFIEGIAQWSGLYILDAVFMLGCAFFSIRFVPDLVQVANIGSNENVGDEESTKLSNTSPQSAEIQTSTLEKFICVLRSPLYACALINTACVGGASAWVLYFILDVIEEQGITGSLAFVAVLGVMLGAPIPANLIGGAVLTRLGGYQNVVSAFTMCVFCSVCAGVFVSVAWIAAIFAWRWTFYVAFWFFIFVCCVPTAALNGICVNSVPPGANVHGSACQFAIQNLSKAVVPGIGGVVVTHFELTTGFFMVNMVCVGTSILFCFIGLYLAKRGVTLDVKSLQNPTNLVKA